MQHDLNDFLIRLPHTVPTQATHIADGGFHALGDDAVAGAELLAVQVHMVSQNACLHAGRDLRRAAGLGTVTDNAGNDGQRVDQGMGNGLAVSALQIGDAAARRAACADRSAVGGQPPDAGLFVDGNEVRQRQRPAEHFLGSPQLPGIL